MADDYLEQRCVNVIRGLAMDGPQRAGNGHPGTAMALAPLAHVLFTRILRHDPSDPGWVDRDRFILSNGHASILLYSMLYLNGYGLTLDDLEHFRQWGSRTPGHPEVHATAGVEVTTGPLGQGFGNAVGMAIAERFLRHRFGPETVDHHVFAFAGDGDLMEGISHEAASLAGHLGLGRLVVVFDDNHITIDGATELACTDDVMGRFQSYGWHTERLGEVANDLDALEAGLRRGMAEADRPSLLVLRSHIGWPSPHRTDTKEAHGDALGADEVRATKALLGLPEDEEFYVPDDVLEFYRARARRGREAREAWEARQDRAETDRAELAACLAGRGLEGWADDLPTFEAGTQLATRKAANKVLVATAAKIPGLLAGAGDLTGNTGVDLGGEADAQSRANPGGRQVHFGIREHAMASTMNGMALHGGVLPVGGTFFVFSDYARPAVRLAALSGAHVVYFFTHDSIGLGEDGPTHQPIEQLASLRAMPGLRVIRPADANETAAAWRLAVELDGPTALVLTRQDVPVLEGTAALARSGVALGGYVLRPAERPDVVLIGTGSEVQHCLGAAAILESAGTSAQVVSLASFELFADADPSHRGAVLPAGVPRLAVEAASSFGWERYADATVAIDHFGASAKASVNMAKFGFTPEHVAASAAAPAGRHRVARPSRSRRAVAAGFGRRPKEPTMTKLHELFERGGQSPWLDNLQRSYLSSGRLADLVAEGVRGLTSNPTIMAKAISAGADYDEEFAALKAKGLGIDDIYWDLVVGDVLGALDVLRPVFDESGGRDGFVSIEVAPSLAHDTEATTSAARDLHTRIDRPNCLVKIPATLEGVPAIRTMIAEGRSINVTLIFSLERYADVIEAYLSGLEALVAAGGDPSGVASVASFFVSRVDTEVDRRLGEVADAKAGTPEAEQARSLCGSAALAQARLAYGLYRERFSGPRWEALAAAGARTQRPLWASTSTKNPAYPDLLYVDGLVAPETVNTMPEDTVERFLDHGRAEPFDEAALAAASKTVADLAGLGIHLEDVAEVLEREGVASFAASFDDLIASLRDKA